MNCYLHTKSPNNAKKDIDSFCEKFGFKNVAVYSKGNSVRRFLAKLMNYFTILTKLKKNDVLLIQYPYKKFYKTYCQCAHMRGAKVITLVHDLGSFRRQRITPEREIKRLSHSDAIIVHNKSMKDWLLEQGMKKPMVQLEIFDYLSDKNTCEYEVDATLKKSLIYAGSLAPRKNKFIYELTPSTTGDAKWEVYGSGLDTTALPVDSTVDYKGFVPSDDFISAVRGGWGVVWDGDSLDACSGNWGDYLRYNNPHKASFYMRAGLPVIMWDKSAMADYIIRNGLGISVATLRDIPDAINRMSDSEYRRLRENVSEIKNKLNEGYFFKRAFQESLQIFNNG